MHLRNAIGVSHQICVPIRSCPATKNPCVARSAVTGHGWAGALGYPAQIQLECPREECCGVRTVFATGSIESGDALGREKSAGGQCTGKTCERNPVGFEQTMQKGE